MKNKNLPFVSVIIPVKKLTYCLLFESLPAFEKQTYNNFEVIVLPNEHVQYDLTLLKKHAWLRIIPTGNITRPAEKRNEGVKLAKGGIIAFIDDDAYPRQDWLENAVKVFDKKFAAVCGPGLVPKNADFWEKIFDEVISSRLGSGVYTYRFKPEKPRFVDDYPSMNFLIRKRIFQKLGGFKGNYWPGEDSKLCEEIVYTEKGKIFYSPKVMVFHHRRKELGGFLKQHANYGFHRGAFLAHGDKNSKRFSYLIPTVFVFYLVLLFLFLIFKDFLQIDTQYLKSLVFLPLIIYLVFAAQLFFQSLIGTGNFFIAFFAPITLFLTHLTYGIIFVKGFLKGIKNKNNIYN